MDSHDRRVGLSLRSCGRTRWKECSPIQSTAAIKISQAGASSVSLELRPSFHRLTYRTGRRSLMPLWACKRRLKLPGKKGKAMANEKTDVVIIGVGAAGGILAAE